jgi:hypothetical protein
MPKEVRRSLLTESTAYPAHQRRSSTPIQQSYEKNQAITILRRTLNVARLRVRVRARRAATPLQQPQ